MTTDPNGPYASSGIVIQCPYCHLQTTASLSQAGHVIECPKCVAKFQVPFATANSSTGNRVTNPAYQEFVSKKVAAGICGILLGGLGIHKFILGFNNAGAIMLSVYLLSAITGMCLFVPFLAAAAMQVIGLVEGVLYLTKTDEEFYQLYAVQKKEWF